MYIRTQRALAVGVSDREGKGGSGFAGAANR